MTWKMLGGSGYCTVEWAGEGMKLTEQDTEELTRIIKQIPAGNRLTAVLPSENSRAAGVLSNYGLEKVKEREVFSKCLKETLNFPDTEFEIFCGNEEAVMRCLDKTLGKNEAGMSMLNDVRSELEEDKFLIYHAVQGGKDAGVFISHLEPLTKDEGRLFYFGLTPEFRGKGMAAALHRYALATLRLELGAQAYIGVTDTDNQAMSRVFHQNGCRLLHTVEIYKNNLV